MIEQYVDLETSDGSMPTWSFRPDGGGPYPVVVFMMDAPGMRQEIRDMASRLATAGYYVMTSQLYYRQVQEYNVFETGDRDQMFELMSGLSYSMVVDDTRAMLELAAQDPAANAERVGTVGYCMSGPFTLIAAAKIESVVAAASIHGVGLAADSDSSPHRNLDGNKAEVYIACAEHDEYAPPGMIAEFEAALEASDSSGRVEWFPGTEHGFAFRERPQYVRAASETHWERLHDLFDRRLRS